MILDPKPLYSEKRMKKTVFFIVAGLLITSCASIDEKTGAELKEEKQFVTGSNLPQRDRSKSGVITVSPETIEAMRKSGTALSAPRTN